MIGLEVGKLNCMEERGRVGQGRAVVRVREEKGWKRVRTG